jgi:hypothetical protein
MKRLIFTFIIILTTSSLYAQTVNFSWARQMGGTLSDIGNAIAVDGTGNVYTTGTFEGTADFTLGTGSAFVTAGATDIFLTKFNSSGTFQWAIQMGGAGADASRGIAADASGNIYITGSFTGTADFDPTVGVVNLGSSGGLDIFVAKYDATTGNLVWARQMGGAAGDDEALALALDATGSNVYTTGYFTGTADFDPNGTFNQTGFGGLDIFVSKLDAAGSFVWAREMGGTGALEFGSAIRLDPDGNVVSTGVFSGASSDLDPVGSAATFTAPGAATDIYVSKLGADGSFVWAKQIGNSADAEQSNSLAIDGTGNIYTTGYIAGTTDFDPDAPVFTLSSLGGRDIFVSKLNSTGTFVWAVSMGNAGTLVGERDAGFAIAVDAASNVYTAGSFGNTVDFDPGVGNADRTSSGERDIFFLILNSAGSYVLAGRAGDVGFDQGQALALTSTGVIHVTGAFQNTVDFDPSPATTNLTSAGGNDVFVLQLSQLIATPLTLVDFTAKPGNQTTQLNWSTASEINTSHFEIEKSLNGTSFSVIGSIKAAGNSTSTKSYSFRDQQASNGNNYYRLKMIDLDGKFTYSKVVAVRMNGKTTLQLSPNPAKNILFVQATGNDKNSLVQITDGAGKIVKEQRIILNGTTSFSIDISNLPRGLYYFSLRSGSKIQQQKIIKQ